MTLLFAAHLAMTLFLVGLIWVVQIVIYPMFAEIPLNAFVDYERKYQRRITSVVMPAMLVELGTGTLIVFLDSPELSRFSQVLNLLFIFAIWLSTALIQVPCHRSLETDFDPQTHRLLVKSNWIRTVLWTVRAFILLLPLLEA